MDFQHFKNYHSETIMYCQAIEHDLKWIFAVMHKGDEINTFLKLEKTTLGTIVNKLKELDNSDNDPFISNSDYIFLKQMTKKRNYWCHQCYLDFIYKDNFLYTEEYIKISNELIKDHDRLKIVSDNVEQARLKAVKLYKR